MPAGEGRVEGWKGRGMCDLYTYIHLQTFDTYLICNASTSCAYPIEFDEEGALVGLIAEHLIAVPTRVQQLETYFSFTEIAHTRRRLSITSLYEPQIRIHKRRLLFKRQTILIQVDGRDTQTPQPIRQWATNQATISHAMTHL